jgi:hypothetical protein
VAGYPVQDVRVIVYDGKHHPVDSKEVAFIAAGKRAFMDAIGKARPLVLEPIVKHRYHGAGIRHGRHRWRHFRQARPDQRHRLQWRRHVTIKAQVPLAELNNYQARLKSATAGQGSYSDRALALRSGAAQRAEGARGAVQQDRAARGAVARKARLRKSAFIAARPLHRVTWSRATRYRAPEAPRCIARAYMASARGAFLFSRCALWTRWGAHR